MADEVVSRTRNDDRIRRGPMTPDIILTEDHIARLRTLRDDSEETRIGGRSNYAPSTFFDADGNIIRSNPRKEM